MTQNDKLYVITRNDIKTGLAAAQCCHGVIEFYRKYPQLTNSWYQNSNYIVLLTVNNEKKLIQLIKILNNKIRFSIFREPDLNNKITSLVLEPCKFSKQFCKKLKLLK